MAAEKIKPKPVSLDYCFARKPALLLLRLTAYKDGLILIIRTDHSSKRRPNTETETACIVGPANFFANNETNMTAINDVTATRSRENQVRVAGSEDEYKSHAFHTTTTE